jgi:hypothetical protein
MTAKGTSGALIELGDTTADKVLLWIIAIGLFAYGTFCIAEGPVPESGVKLGTPTAT